MKILRIINTLKTGGAERSIETNVPVHNSHGYNTDVLVLNGQQTPFMDNLEKDGVRLIKLSGLSLYNPLQALRIIKYIKGYDIVHVHLFPAFYWAALAKVLSCRKVKLVYTEHSTSNHRRGRIFFRVVDRLVYRCYDRIIAISPAAKENLVKHIGREDGIVVVENGVNLKPFISQKEVISLFPGSDKSFIVTQVASFRFPKDQDTVIRAMSKTAENVHAVFVGIGDRMDECKNLATDLGVADRVHFLGGRMDIPAIVRSSSVVVMSSSYEGFGRAAIEGMAGSKPVIGSDVAGLRDLVKGAGILFNVGDDKSLAGHIERLRTDEEYYDTIAVACFERSKEYSSEKMIEGYEAIYNELMSK